MMICRELGLTLQQGMELSVFEIKCWAAYFSIEQQELKEHIKHGGKNNNKGRR